MVRRSGTFRIGLMALVVVGLSACAANYRNHGYIPPAEDLDEIVVGVDTRDSVAETVGSPTSSGLLDDSGYYYVRSRMKTLGFRAPQEVEREVVAISFDTDGVVTNIERFGLENGRVVTLDRRVTETSVVDRTFLRQLLGAFGRLRPASF